MGSTIKYQQEVTAENAAEHLVNKAVCLSRYGQGGTMPNTFSYIFKDSQLKIILTMTQTGITY